MDKLPAPEIVSPDNNNITTDRTPIFTMILTEDTENVATKYHARVRISDTLKLDSGIIYESKENETNWELWDSETSTWIPFPSGGVDPGSKVRLMPPKKLNYSAYYWDAASHDGIEYGYNSNYRKITIQITVNELYTLNIAGTEYNAYRLSCLETANGEIGSISFQLNNENNTANIDIDYGDEVVLGVNDKLGNTDQFKARVKQKNPEGKVISITAITGDGILSERIIKEDFPEQDIGITAKSIIDTYCSPLTSVNIDTDTGIIAPIPANQKKPVTVFEDMRKNHNISYYVDNDWDVHLFTADYIVDDPNMTIRRGD